MRLNARALSRLHDTGARPAACGGAALRAWAPALGLGRLHGEITCGACPAQWKQRRCACAMSFDDVFQFGHIVFSLFGVSLRAEVLSSSVGRVVACSC